MSRTIQQNFQCLVGAVSNMNFCVRMISVYLANAQATRIKIKIEPTEVATKH